MAIEIEEALESFRQNVDFLKKELIPLENALGRIIAENIYAIHFLPRFNNSAMDGYAVKISDAGKTVKVKDTILAGQNKELNLKSGRCVKVMTGAMVPLEAEAVIPQEDVEIVDKKTIILPKKIKDFQHIKFVGEDVKNGELLIEEGDEINSAKVTILSSQGVTHIQVYKKPKIAVFASGEELKLHFETVEKHQIYNSNTPTLLARAKELGCDVSFVGSAKDNIESLIEMIHSSLDADLIITSGGVSVGEADFTKDAFETFEFETIFDGINVKPGKPTVFGMINNSFVLNLPGNPLASALIFEYFGKILVQCLKGSNKTYHNAITAKVSESFSNKPGRSTIVPGQFDGEYFTPSIKRSPGMVNVLNHCNSIIMLDSNVNRLESKQEVKVIPIDWQFFTSEPKDIITYE